MRWMATALLLLAATAAAGKIKQKEPGPKAKGKRYEWTASNGGLYLYYVPKNFNPDEVDGIVAMASGIWEHRNFGQAKHQAIVVMHGTYDPVVPYGAGVYAYRKCREAGYPKLHFRSLEGWNHWPTDYNSKVPHTAQQLAWCEGMTTKDMERLKVSFEFLATVKAKERHDYAAVYSLAKHIANLDGAPGALKKRAERAMKTVDAGARAHVAALKKVPDPVTFEKKPWVGHLPMFLRAYRGVPAREDFAKTWERVLSRHAEEAVPHLRVFFRSKDPAEAFTAGVEAIKVGFLHYECIDTESFRKKLRQMRNNKQLKLGKDALKAYDALVPDFERALKDAFRSFDGVNRKVGKL